MFQFGPSSWIVHRGQRHPGSGAEAQRGRGGKSGQGAKRADYGGSYFGRNEGADLETYRGLAAAVLRKSGLQDAPGEIDARVASW